MGQALRAEGCGCEHIRGLLGLNWESGKNGKFDNGLYRDYRVYIWDPLSSKLWAS